MMKNSHQGNKSLMTVFIYRKYTVFLVTSIANTGENEVV